MEDILETLYIKGEDGNPTRINAASYDKKKHGPVIDDFVPEAATGPIGGHNLASSEPGTGFVKPRLSIMQGNDGRFYVVEDGKATSRPEYDAKGYADAPAALAAINSNNAEFLPLDAS